MTDTKMTFSTHPYLDTLQPYQPVDLTAAAERAGRAVDQLVRLNANENPFGLPPQAAQALAEYGAYHLHPDYAPLKRAIAAHAGGTPQQVVLSNGADELIDLLVRLCVEPGQAVVCCPPTFGTYGFCAQANRCQTLAVDRRDDFSLDVEAIEAAVQHSQGVARLLFYASPGNPGGQPVPLETTRRLLGLPLIVAVDEAYGSFGGQSAVSLLASHENLVIIRTFSKWAGMAGLRLGYALLAPHMAGMIERIRLPYNVNAAAVVAATAILADPAGAQANVARLVAERERLQTALAALPWLDVIPTQTNFVLLHPRGPSAPQVIDRLAQQGILVQGYPDPPMADFVRISVGRREQNDRVLAVLQSIQPEETTGP